jgi:hypothetical protein
MDNRHDKRPRYCPLSGAAIIFGVLAAIVQPGPSDAFALWLACCLFTCLLELFSPDLWR